MFRELHIFDFDGTLFESPADTPENRKKYEKATGIPWLIDKEQSRQLTSKLKRFVPIRRGWWGRAETLEPPIVPNPAPKEWFKKDVCDQFHASKKNSDVMTVIMTGRHRGLASQVLRICADGKLFDVKEKWKDDKPYHQNDDPNVTCFFLGDRPPGPQGNIPGETFPWKSCIIDGLILTQPEVTQIQIWEDRDEHVGKFKALEDVLGLPVTVHHVK